MIPPTGSNITYFAQTDARNRRIPFGIKQVDRSKHVYVIGKTGMGKSTLLENMAVQDIQNGNGLTFIDPHGSTAEKLLDYIPEERIDDVLYFAPFDLAYPISFNVMENVDADKRHLVIAGLMAAFEKIWVDAWSARMAYILQNTLAALLEYPDATLLGVNRMYTDKEFRKKVVENITDPTVRSFWVDEYSKYTDRYTQEATPAIQNKIGQFASNPLIRNIIGQPQSAFNIRDLMDERKIFIVNLSKGRVGEGNANLLGSMLITKLYLAAMSRADLPPDKLAKLSDHFLFVDEFQSFANRSFADILSEARKYKLSLTIAHQYIEQMEEEVRAAVFGNVGTMITFRVGAYDADVLEKEFAPAFSAQDLVNLGARQIYLKLMIDGISSQPFSATTLPPIEMPKVSHRDRAIAYSRKHFARPRADVEREIIAFHAPIPEPPAELRERARRADEPPRRRMAPNGERPRGTDELRGGRPGTISTGRTQGEMRDPRRPREHTNEDLRDTLARLAKQAGSGPEEKTASESEAQKNSAAPRPEKNISETGPMKHPNHAARDLARPPGAVERTERQAAPAPKNAEEKAHRAELKDALSALLQKTQPVAPSIEPPHRPKTPPHREAADPSHRAASPAGEVRTAPQPPRAAPQPVSGAAPRAPEAPPAHAVPGPAQSPASHPQPAEKTNTPPRIPVPPVRNHREVPEDVLRKLLAVDEDTRS